MKKRNLVPQMVTSLLALLLATGAWAAPPQSQLETKTTALAVLAKRYLQEDPASQQALLQQLVKIATERRQLLAESVAENPGAVLRTALPAALVESLPPQVQAQLETRTELEGELEVLYEDYADHHVLRHFLKRGTDRFELHFDKAPKGLQSGLKARVNGVSIGDSLVADSDGGGLLILADGATGSSSSSNSGPAVLPNTLGEQKAAVLLVNFQDNPTSQPWTVTEAQDLVFGSVNDFYMENSYQQTWLSGDVHGWLTLPINKTCSGSEIANAAAQTAQNAGIDLSGYDRFIYAFPYVTGCGWTGKGTVGGLPSHVWVNGFLSERTVGHELGHNFGLYHSHGLEGGDTVIGDNPSTIEYGDSLDIMGKSGVVGHFNAFQKARLGWLGTGNSPPVEVAYANGNYTIELQELPGQASKSLKVLRSEDPVTGDRDWFYLEYRQDIGKDAWLAGNNNVLQGVIVHLGNDTDPNSSRLLDMTPASSSSSDWSDPALVVGRSFTDNASGVTLSPSWSDGSGIGIDVSYEQASCNPAAPQINVSPAQALWVEAGTSVFFQVTVTNNDSSACASGAFDLAAALPGGWTSGFDQPSLTLAPGESGATVLTVSSDSAAVDGFYDIPVTAASSTSPALNASATVTYVVSNGASNTAPVAVDDAAATAVGTPVTIAVLANDSDPDGDPFGVVSASNGSGGTVTVNGDGTVTYTPKKRFSGTDLFSYTVSDGSDTASAQVQVAVSKQGGDKGGGNTGSTGGGKGGGKGGKK